MKRFILLLATAVTAISATAQNSFPSTGNAGVGTTSPVNILNIIANSQNYENPQYTSGLRINDIGNSTALLFGVAADKNNGYIQTVQPTVSWITRSLIFQPYGGNVGIGTKSPHRKLDIGVGGEITFGNDVVSHTTSGIYWHSDDHYGIYRTSGSWAGENYQQLRLQFDTGIQLAAGPDVNIGYGKSYVEVLSGKGLMVSSGNVGIGTTDTKGYKLAVAGSAVAESMTIKLRAQWADYVFKPSYKLPELKQVEKFIAINGHLPEMPSEAEVKQKGVDVGEMLRIQTKKIEELTLYLLQQQARMNRLEQELKDVKAVNKRSKPRT